MVALAVGGGGDWGRRAAKGLGEETMRVGIGRLGFYARLLPVFRTKRVCGLHTVGAAVDHLQLPWQRRALPPRRVVAPPLVADGAQHGMIRSTEPRPAVIAGDQSHHAAIAASASAAVDGRVSGRRMHRLCARKSGRGGIFFFFFLHLGEEEKQ